MCNNSFFVEEKERGGRWDQENERRSPKSENGGSHAKGQEICTKVQQRHKGGTFKNAFGDFVQTLFKPIRCTNSFTQVNLDMSMWITHNYTKEEQEEYAPKLELAPYEAPKYEAPKYEAPKYEAPKYEAPKYEAPKYEAPKYEEPTTTAYEAPAYSTSAYEAPATEAPKYEEPAKYEEPESDEDEEPY